MIPRQPNELLMTKKGSSGRKGGLVFVRLFLHIFFPCSSVSPHVFAFFYLQPGELDHWYLDPAAYRGGVQPVTVRLVGGLTAK